MSGDIDFAADKDAPVSAETLSQIFDLVETMQILEDRIKKGVALMKELVEAHAKIERLDLPELMESAHLKELPIPKGGTLKVTPIIKASLPSKGAIDKARGEKQEELQERLDAGLAWLRANKAEGLIKEIFTADLGKDKSKVAAAMAKIAQANNVACDTAESVHAGTLSAYVKEQIQMEKGGKVIPMDIFAVFTGSQAKITKAK